MNAGKLKAAIERCQTAEDAYIAAREEMRRSVREYLSSFQERGELIAIAGKLDVSIVQVSNLKGGYSVPSVETARAILRATA